MIVGFTASQSGVTSTQLQQLSEAFTTLRFKEFHHGDCIGGDCLAHALVRYFKPHTKIHIHPCNIDSKRAYCYPDRIYDVKRPLVRNQDIVDVCDVLLACPAQPEEILRSGTWSTIRRGWQKFGKDSGRVIILYPHGTDILCW